MDSKACSKCGEVKLLTEFNFKNFHQGKRHCQCRGCTRMQVRRHYRLHQRYYIRKATRRKARVGAAQREWLSSYLELHPCVDCGEADPRCLDFDHIKGKKRCDVSRMFG